MSAEDDFDDATSYEREGYDLCYCGCTRAEHDEASGRCQFCDDCDGFTYDHDGTVIACAERPDVP